MEGRTADSAGEHGEHATYFLNTLSEQLFFHPQVLTEHQHDAKYFTSCSHTVTSLSSLHQPFSRDTHTLVVFSVPSLTFHDCFTFLTASGLALSIPALHRCPHTLRFQALYPPFLSTGRHVLLSSVQYQAPISLLNLEELRQLSKMPVTWPNNEDVPGGG